LLIEVDIIEAYALEEPSAQEHNEARNWIEEEIGQEAKGRHSNGFGGYLIL
jgi:hypothetical protein